MAKMYQEVSTVTLPRERTKAIRKEFQQACGQEQNNDCMSTSAWTSSTRPSKNLSAKKAPGPDNITNDMILHFGSKAKHTLLHYLMNPGGRGKSHQHGKRPTSSQFTKKEKKNKRWKVIDQSVCQAV